MRKEGSFANKRSPQYNQQMQLMAGDGELETLNRELNDPLQLEAYKKPYEHYPTLLLPRLLGGFLVWCGNRVYGQEPSYLKFRAVEVIARVPYHSWASATYTLLTAFYTHEDKAMQLSHIAQYARIAQDNETMHVVVISQLAHAEGKVSTLRQTLIPMIFAFFYFWASYFLYLMRPRWSLELNYLFEQHAFEQYDRFLQVHEEALKKKPMTSEFLAWYGRNPRNQYEFFRSIRNDELIHRNQSIHGINLQADIVRVRSLKFITACLVVIALMLEVLKYLV